MASAQLHVDDVASAFRKENFTVEFYQSTEDIYWHGLIGLHPYILGIDIGSRPSSRARWITHYRDLLKTWYGWCEDNCESEFIITENGFAFESNDDYLLFKITFGDPAMSNGNV